MIEIKNLSSGYGKNNILSDISCTFKKEKLTSVVGVNGSGKTTLLKTIVGILPTFSGEITVDGITLSEIPSKERAKKIAYLPQGRDLVDMTAFEFVLHGRFPYLGLSRRYCDEDKMIARKAMAKMKISDIEDQPISSLSGGIRQKVYIAMALAQMAEYILLDEPATYLDISHQLSLLEILKSCCNEGKGVITVMHDLPMAMNYSDEIALVSNGKILTQATPREIYESGILTEIFGVGIGYSESDKKYFYK